MCLWNIACLGTSLKIQLGYLFKMYYSAKCRNIYAHILALTHAPIHTERSHAQTRCLNRRGSRHPINKCSATLTVSAAFDNIEEGILLSYGQIYIPFIRSSIIPWGITRGIYKTVTRLHNPPTLFQTRTFCCKSRWTIWPPFDLLKAASNIAKHCQIDSGSIFLSSQGWTQRRWKSVTVVES